MTVQTQDRTPAPERWAAEDEIDLRQYLDVLIRWWREIVLITLSAMVLAAVGILLSRLILPAQCKVNVELGVDTVSLSNHVIFNPS